MIKETVNEYRFRDVLLADEFASWSYGATKALFDYYEQLSDDIGEDIELDRVAIRCEWTEYDSALEKVKEHTGGDLSCLDIDWLDANESENDEMVEKKCREWLEERTAVLDVENIDTSANEYRTIKSILIMQF